MKKIQKIKIGCGALCIGITLLAASCKKSLPDLAPINSSQYYMRFKANGAQKEFTATTAYYFTTTCSINGGTNDSTGNGFTINIISVNAPILGNSMYNEIETIPASGGYTPTAYFAYAINSPSNYNYGSWIAEPAEHSVYACTVKILELDATHVKGTFSGRVRERKGSNFITISNGEFNVKRIL
jgi:hypothetical protein